MNVTLTRRTWLLGALGAASWPRVARAALRIPDGGVLRLPLPATRRTLDPARATDIADTWLLGLTHDTLATLLGDGTTTWPLLTAPPTVDRTDPRIATLSLRAGMAFSDGTPITAAAVVDAWRAARSSPLGRLALSRLDTMNPFDPRGPLDITVRVAVPGTLDETLAAWPLAVAGPSAATGIRGGVGAFMTRGTDGGTLVRNPRCPTGGAFLERIELAPPRPRNDELRAFTTAALDASWWGNSLYEVSRPAEAVRGPASVVVGMVPTLNGPLASAAAARTLEQSLAALCAGEGAILTAPGLTSAPDVAPDLVALVRTLNHRGLRVAREASDGLLSAVAERVVALLDAAGIAVMLVNPDEACDAALRAVAPLAADASVALASFMAAAAAAGGDEAGASAIVRSAGAARTQTAASVWGRSTVAVLGRAAPVLHVRADVRDARFDGAGRLQLADAWLARSP